MWVRLLDLTHKFESFSCILKLLMFPLGLILMDLFESVGRNCSLLFSPSSRTCELTKKSFLRRDDRNNWSYNGARSIWQIAIDMPMRPPVADKTSAIVCTLLLKCETFSSSPNPTVNKATLVSKSGTPGWRCTNLISKYSLKVGGIKSETHESKSVIKFWLIL